MATTCTMPTPEIFFDMAFAYERSAALKAAVGLDLFTAIVEGADIVGSPSTTATATISFS